jgi:hypothetical protein
VSSFLLRSCTPIIELLSNGDRWTKTNVKRNAAHKPFFTARYYNTTHLNMNATAKKSKQEPIWEEVYQKKSPKQHILLRPDSYVGKYA